jgi:eukaryotic-like serine/threonine-protein kinase
VLTAPSDEPEGTVIAQDPAAGTEVEAGDVVTITVSEGEEQQEMPDVTGQDGNDAEAFLESEFGLVVEQVEEPCADAIPPGAVCRQEPEPGTPVSEGDSAVLYVQPGEASLPGGAVALLIASLLTGTAPVRRRYEAAAERKFFSS